MGAIRGLLATIAGLAALTASGTARADLIWNYTEGDGMAFLAVVDEADAEEAEAHHPFYMACSSSDGETSVVSIDDPQAMAAAIAGGDVPSFSYVLDGNTLDPAWQVADIRFGQMDGLWQYVAHSVPTVLFEGVKTVRIEGVGVAFDLPTGKMAEYVADFTAACDKIAGAAAVDGGGEDTGSSEAE